jgi:hypothetical protein
LTKIALIYLGSQDGIEQSSQPQTDLERFAVILCSSKSKYTNFSHISGVKIKQYMKNIVGG